MPPRGAEPHALSVAAATTRPKAAPPGSAREPQAARVRAVALTAMRPDAASVPAVRDR